MEDDLMIQTDLASDQEVEPANTIQVLCLVNQMILIAEIDEVLADIGQPDCKLINPCVIADGKLSKWMSDLTPNKEMFMSSDKILTLVDPTKKLLDKEWFTSQYGSPPIELSTPLILERVIDSIDLNKFQMGTFEDNFYLSLDFKDVVQNENSVNLDLIKNGLINEFQVLGSKNILVKDDQFTVKSGDTALRLYGSLDIEFNNDLYRSNFTSIILPYDKKTIKLIIVYRDEDRYANDIESRILESFDIIKEL